MITKESVSTLIQHARELANKARDIAKKDEPTELDHDVLVLEAPYAELAWHGDTSVIVRSQLCKFTEPVYLADRERIYGLVELAKPKAITVPEFRRRAKEHRIPEDTRKSLWPLHRRLYAYKIESIEKLEQPQPWNCPPDEAAPAIEPRFKRAPTAEELSQLTDANHRTLESVLSLSQAFTDATSHFVERAIALTRPDDETQRLLSVVVASGPQLCKEYVELASGLQLTVAQKDEERNPFILAERLTAQLKAAVECLPAKTRITDLSKSAVDSLTAFSALEPQLGCDAYCCIDPEEEEEREWIGKEGRFQRVNPDNLRTASDKVLLAMYRYVQRVLDTAFADGRTTTGHAGESLEDVTNALTFIKDEMRRRGMNIEATGSVKREVDWDAVAKAGPSDRYAPILPGSDGGDLPLTLDDVLPHFHDEFLLRSPFVYVVGSICNNGATEHDVDIMLRGPLDDSLALAAQHRLGRMLPPDISKRVQFLCGDTEEHKMSLAGPVGAHVPIYDLVVRRREDSHTVVEMRDAEPETDVVKADDVFVKYPSSERAYPAVLQHHVRGKTVHGDIRIKSDRYLVGWTVADQKPGKLPLIKTLEDANRIIGTFNMKGSSWNKAMVAPGRVYATPKAPEPHAWLTIDAEEFAEGGVGATRYHKGYMICTARPVASYGLQTPQFHEYFFEKDPKFYGLFALRMLTGEGASDPVSEAAGRKTPEGVSFWVAMFTKSLVPSVLKQHAVDTGRIPPQGWAAIPPGLKAVIPKHFQYWHSADEKERREIRDALVEDGFINDENIKIVDYQFRRIVTKHYLYQPDGSLDKEAIGKKQEAGPDETGPDKIQYTNNQPPRPDDQTTPRSDACQQETSTEQPVAKAVETRTISVGGQKLDVQVWDPKNIKPGDDKTGDRESLQPLAIYMPMKVASGNEFTSSDVDALFTKFATPEMLKIGIAVQPKYNGFRIVMQKDDKGRLLAITEDIWERQQSIYNLLDGMPGLRKELEAIPGPYILDGEFMAVMANGDPIPRRELAGFRGGTDQVVDKNVRVQVFDILFHPKAGNVLAKPYKERLPLLTGLMKGHANSRLRLTPVRVAHSKEQLLASFEWARRIPGSEGAMLKSLEGTVTLRETDSQAKLKMVRELKGVVWAKHPVKGSPGVYNYMYAVGPVAEEEAKTWAEPVKIGDKTYIKCGKTFNTSVSAGTGDVLRIEVTELLLDESRPDAKRVRGFTPTVIDKANGAPTSIAALREMLAAGELKTTREDAEDAVAKRLQEQTLVARIIKQEEQEERYVLGVVLEPDVVDSQGDIYDAETVRKAAHFFMESERAQQLGLMHEQTLPDQKVRILESYIAPVDMSIEGQRVRKGTWLLAARILDDRLWQAVKDGRLTGWSIEGTAIAMELD